MGQQMPKRTATPDAALARAGAQSVGAPGAENGLAAGVLVALAGSVGPSEREQPTGPRWRKPDSAEANPLRSRSAPLHRSLGLVAENTVARRPKPNMPPKGTQGMSSKRIAKELTDLSKPDALPQGCSAGPITDDNVHEWRATIGQFTRVRLLSVPCSC